VLRGIDDEDWPRIRQIVTEVHDREGEQTLGRVQEISELLKEQGFEVVVEEDAQLKETGIYNLYARRAERRWESAVKSRLEQENQSSVITEAGLRQYLQQWLPGYMIPGRIVLLEKLPLTANGKVDRKALPAPSAENAISGEELAEARTAVEEVVAGIFSEVLHREQVSVTADFFELGGHSLLATQVISRINSAFGIEMPIRSLFERPSVRGLGQEIAELRRAGVESEAPALVAGERGERLPLSYAQQRLWFLEQLTPGNTAYNLPAAVRMKGRLEVGALAESLSEVVRRH